MHWVVLSVAAAIPTALLLSFEQESLQLLLSVGMMVGGLLLGAITVSCAFAILLSVANDHDQVEDWPSMDIFQWIKLSMDILLLWAFCHMDFLHIYLHLCFPLDSIYLLSVPSSAFAFARF